MAKKAKGIAVCKFLNIRTVQPVLILRSESLVPQVLLIDEIDKAPRDFPNDLLHELDQMEFTITETRQKVSAIQSEKILL